MRIPTATDAQLSLDEKRHLFRGTWAFLRPQRGWVLLASVLVLAQASGMLAGPAIVRYGIDQGVRQGDLGALNLATIAFLAAATGAYVAGFVVIRTIARIGERFLFELRETVFQRLMNQSLEFYDRSKTGALVSRMTADVEALQELVGQGLPMFLVNALLLTGAIFVMIGMSWQLALGTLVLVPFVTKVSIWFRRESNRAYLHLRDRVGITLSSLQEGIAGVREVQAFHQGEAFLDRFEETNEQQYGAHLGAERIAALYFPAIEFSQGFAIAVILGLGGFLTTRETVTVGTVAAFVLYLQNLFEPIQQLSQLFNTLQAAGAALQKLFALLDEPVSLTERPGAVDLPERGVLDIDGVSFAYAGGPPVLHDVSMQLQPGQRLALVGPTGAGKSTLAKLMVRLYDPTEGKVRYGGVDLRDARLSSLRQRIAVVPQEGFLFEGTIRDNVVIGRLAASDDDIWTAVDDIGLRRWFERFPLGLDTSVRERGANLSAGERQLVSLVRAALADPAVIVLDEATSSLDPGTELAVEQTLERLMQDRTVIVVAHRLSTAARADVVAVVQDGRLVELGHHHDLLAANGAYAALFASWLGPPLTTPVDHADE